LADSTFSTSPESLGIFGGLGDVSEAFVLASIDAAFVLFPRGRLGGGEETQLLSHFSSVFSGAGVASTTTCLRFSSTFISGHDFSVDSATFVVAQGLAMGITTF